MMVKRRASLKRFQSRSSRTTSAGGAARCGLIRHMFGFSPIVMPALHLGKYTSQLELLLQVG